MKRSGMPEVSELKRGNVRFVPVLPGRLEFAMEVRRAILLEQPKVVAVELPVSLERQYLKAVDRLPEISVIMYADPDAPQPTLAEMDSEDFEGRAIYVPVEPADPFVEAVRTAREIGSEIMFIEPDLNERPHVPDRAPDSYSLRSIGYERYVQLYREHAVTRSTEIDVHAAAMAWKLQGSDPLANVLAVVSLNMLERLLEAFEVPQEPPPESRRYPSLRLVNPHPDCLIDILAEYPFLQDRYEHFRHTMLNELSVDRPRVQLDLLRIAEQTYNTNTGDHVLHWQRMLIARYSRNLALMDGDLTPSIFDLAVAARSVVDDNFGWEVWDNANKYLAQRSVSALETVHISGEEMYFQTRRIRLRRRLPNFKKRVRPGFKARKKEKREGEWAEQIDGDSICSYPPEDLVIENYARFLKSKAKSILSEERERVYPFTTSLLDGIDLRETIRNWHEGKIYVRQQEKVSGDVGSVIVIFDEDKGFEEKYGFMTTWLGENQNESDMAFYSSYPFEHMVGPGIGRAEYGGLLMSLPPRRMYDVWSDPDYDFAETKAERLLLAGLDYSVGRLVVYVAAKPPRSVFRSIAARTGMQILYIPLGQLSSEKLKKLRVVHVLDGHARRSDAKDYIW
ncbi:MAG TPA: hypothetical protein VE621_15875 [Bryobacteraceae bacterium]|nr:hypothetical protein [Bryobacteraceae bacterium]